MSSNVEPPPLSNVILHVSEQAQTQAQAQEQAQAQPQPQAPAPAPKPIFFPLPPPPLLTTTTPTTAPSKSREITKVDRLLENELRYPEVDKFICDDYVATTANSSTICDILAMYLKGQKILYTESKTVCEQRLNFLMLPAIMITAIASILSLVLRDFGYGATIVSSLNGANAFLLALISYLKLDAKAEAHRTAAYKFDKLQSFMEFNSGRMLFDSKASENLIPIIEKLENDVRDIKETNQFILPEKIRYEYPQLYSINVFSVLKKYQNEEMLHVNKIKDYFNQLRVIKSAQTPSEQESAQVKRLETWIAYEINEIINLKNKYLSIDDLFDEEMKVHRESKMRYCDWCAWLKS